MARLSRWVLPGQPQHIIQRGNNREPIFGGDEDYRFFLEKLKAACRKHSCEVHAYVLMTNHIHLLLTPQTEQGIGKVMQSIGRYYVRYFNYTYQRTGTLWEGRYKATLLDSEQYLLTCYRYIELNPVRANMVKHPRDYPWSSYHYNALGKEDSLVIPHERYLALGQTTAERQATYRQLFKSHLSGQIIAEIRTATNGAWALGDHRFREKLEKLSGRRTNPKPRGGDRKSQQYREGQR